jgi:diaminopimelate decarboxylase
MDYFRYSKEELYCEGVKVSRLAKEYGTPLYVYSLKTFVRHFEVVHRAFGDTPHLICYAAKANSNLAILKMAGLLGGGADVVSGGELRLALKSGIKADKIVFSGVGKTDEEIRLALESGILFISAESLTELETIARVARNLKIAAPVSIRVNPDIDPLTHPHIATGLKETKFGLSESDARKAYDFIRDSKWLNPVGISMHIGSQVGHVEPYVDSAKKLIGLYHWLRRRNIRLEFIDIGGGWAVPFGPDDHFPNPGDYVLGLSDLFAGIEATFIVEPGRSIVGNSGILVMKVIAVKKSGTRRYCVVDAGMNDFIRPVLYNAAHRILPLKMNSGRKIKYDVVGPICESSDYLAKNVGLTSVATNDCLALFTAGAYGYSMGSNYNSRPRPAEIAVAADRAIVIRTREAFDSLLRNQRPGGINRRTINDLKRSLNL